MTDSLIIPGYRIESEIGRGGMATVYRAIQESLERPVALKVMAPALVVDEDSSERFLKEGRTAAQLTHPHILAVHDIGVSGHHHYIAMEYVGGGDLKGRIRAGLAPDAALQVVRQIATALGFVHERGFVHRDVKPRNILFRDDGTAVLADFGIARAVGGGTRMTGTGMSIGTPHYMSPEQARGQTVDARSDLYSLGIVLYEALTGSVPFDAEDSVAVGIQHVTGPLPQLPEHLQCYQPLLDRLLAKDPAERPADAGALATLLDQVLAGETLENANVRPSDGTHVMPKQAATTPSPNPRGRGGGLKWGLSGGLAALVLLGGVYFWQQGAVLPERKMIGGGGGGTEESSASDTEAAETTFEESEDEGEESRDDESVLPSTIDPDERASAAGSGPDELVGSGEAILDVRSEPEGAVVELAGQRLGKTPLTAEALPAGAYELVVRKAFFEPQRMEVELERRKVLKKRLTLSRGSGSLTVLTEPSGARVEVDGQAQSDTTPLTLEGVDSGTHQLRVSKARYKPVEAEVELAAGGTARRKFELQGGDLVELQGEWLKPEEAVSQLLAAAEEDLANDRLTTPQDDNALEKYRRVLEIAPDQASAEEGLVKIVERYLEMARSARKAEEYGRAERFLDRAASVGVAQSRVESLQSQIQRERVDHSLWGEAQALWQKGQWAEAVEAYERYLSECTTCEHDEQAEQRTTVLAERYLIIGSNENVVADIKTGLEWMRCSLGQRWDGQTCRGDADEFTSRQAREAANRHEGWRMPNIEELSTLVYCSDGNPTIFPEREGCGGADYKEPTIVEEAFPNTPASGFWSASPEAGGSDRAWSVNFSRADDFWSKSTSYRVRLVRGGQ